VLAPGVSNVLPPLVWMATHSVALMRPRRRPSCCACSSTITCSPTLIVRVFGAWRGFPRRTVDKDTAVKLCGKDTAASMPRAGATPGIWLAPAAVDNPWASSDVLLLEIFFFLLLIGLPPLVCSVHTIAVLFLSSPHHFLQTSFPTVQQHVNVPPIQARNKAAQKPGCQHSQVPASQHASLL
jgi:hypothetical protein